MWFFHFFNFPIIISTFLLLLLCHKRAYLRGEICDCSALPRYYQTVMQQLLAKRWRGRWFACAAFWVFSSHGAPFSAHHTTVPTNNMQQRVGIWNVRLYCLLLTAYCYHCRHIACRRCSCCCCCCYLLLYSAAVRAATAEGPKVNGCCVRFKGHVSRVSLAVGSCSI